MSDAAKAEGVSVYKRKDADDFFDRSDNFAFAQFGVIAHTIAVAFEYPDYHGLGDKCGKDRLRQHGDGGPRRRGGNRGSSPTIPIRRNGATQKARRSTGTPEDKWYFTVLNFEVCVLCTPSFCPRKGLTNNL